VRTAAESVHLVAATVGFVSFFLLWFAVVWGIVLRNGWAQTRVKHATVYTVHMLLALLGLCLGIVHALAQLANPTGLVTWVHLLVPFIHPYDPIGIGIGAISLEVLTAITLSVLIQRWLGYTRWRSVHVFAYMAFMLVVVHVLVSGTDIGPAYVWGSVLGAWLATVVLWLASTVWFTTTRRRLAGRVSSEQQQGRVLSVNVDSVRCGRYGFCEHQAPGVFRLRSDGRLSYRASVAVDEAGAVVRAAEVCPTRAIGLTQKPSVVLLGQHQAAAIEEPSRTTTRDPLHGRHRLTAGLRLRKAPRRGNRPGRPPLS
jgi:ferredoxin/DMSO/TMAO reductase YedYZ heme-binding membrane subunit